MNKTSAAQIKAVRNYEKNHVKKYTAILNNDIANAFNKYIEDTNQTKNGAINALIKNELVNKGYL